jgi:hypothetical protein
MKVVFAGVLLLGLLVAGLALALRTVPRSISQPSTQLAVSRDAEVVRYREMVNADIKTIDVEYQRGWTCKTRDGCIAAQATVKAATNALLNDAATHPAPKSLATAEQQLKAAAEQFAVQLDAAVVLMREPNSNFAAAAGAPNVHDLDYAVATIVCWPLKPVETSPHTNMSCT